MTEEHAQWLAGFIAGASLMAIGWPVALGALLVSVACALLYKRRYVPR